MIKIIDDPTHFVIDVLRMELEQKLPYWLSKGLKEDAMAANHTGAAVSPALILSWRVGSAGNGSLSVSLLPRPTWSHFP